jgi:hypothetical protein
MLLNLALLGLWLLPNLVQSTSESQCPVYGQVPPRSTGIIHNYIIDSFSGGRFPFAIDKCTSVEVISTNIWHKYMCIKEENGTDWAVEKRMFTDASCSGTGTLVTTIVRNLTNSISNFECDGVNSYAKLQISLSSTCSSSVTVYAGLNGCAATSTGSTQFEVFCNSTVAFVEFFQVGLNESMASTTTGMPMSTTGAPMSTTNMGLSSTDLNNTMPSMNLNDTMPSTTLGITMNATSLFSTTKLFVNTNNILSTLISTFMPSNTMMSSTQTQSRHMCNDQDYCEVWILPAGKCTLANTTAFRSTQYKIYGQLLSCQTNLTGASTTHKPSKSGSVRSQFAVAAIFTLLLAVSWL